jgi:deoxyribose-phosphate aldolase
VSSLPRDMDQLVEVITSRVRGRLAERGVSLPDADAGCGCGTSCGCDSCGISHGTHHDPSLVRPITAELSPAQLARVIDHTQLKPETDRAQIEQLCKDARAHGFFSVCVNAAMVHYARALLSGCPVKVCAVVGFPLGASTPGSKAYEAREAIRCGADEIDMVLNIGALKSRDYALVEEDICKVVRAVHPKPVKVILETSLLDNDQKVIACALSKAAGAAFVKTSTGFGGGGATVEDITLMRRVVGPDVGVKASGGVRDYAGALALLRAGANRLGCSSSVAIVTGKQSGGGY